MKTDTELLNHLISEWKKKAKQAKNNLEGTKIERMQHRFRAQMQAYDECAKSLQTAINADRDYKKMVQ